MKQFKTINIQAKKRIKCSLYSFVKQNAQRRHGLGVVYCAHNPGVLGSKPVLANFFVIIWFQTKLMITLTVTRIV